MDAVRKRREYLIWQEQVDAEEKRINFLKKMKQETMRCNILAQRITLQEYMMVKVEDINKDIDEWVNDEEAIKKLDRTKVEEMFDDWLSGFKIEQPSDFFRENPTNDAELVCSTETEKEFMLTTLEFFGLPRGYMEGTGHFPTWGLEKKDDKLAIARKRAQAKNQKKTNKGTANKILEMKKARGLNVKEEIEIKPTYFDISIFQKCLKKFVACNGQVRSYMRKQLLKDIDKTMTVFLDEFNEQSFKKCVDVYELAGRLVKEGYEFDPILVENMGSILLCFGEIEHELRYGERIPEETEEEKKMRVIAELNIKRLEEERKEAEANGEELPE